MPDGISSSDLSLSLSGSDSIIRYSSDLLAIIEDVALAELTLYKSLKKGKFNIEKINFLDRLNDESTHKIKIRTNKNGSEKICDNSTKYCYYNF